MANPFKYDESSENHWSKYIQERQEKYNKLKYYVWVMKDFRLGAAKADLELVQEHENKLVQIEQWAKSEGITIKEHLDRERDCYPYRTKGVEYDVISERWEFIPPSVDVKINKPTKKESKGGRPVNPKIAERNKKISRDYYRLKSQGYLTTKKIIKQLADKYQLATSTIEKYLK